MVLFSLPKKHPFRNVLWSFIVLKLARKSNYESDIQLIWILVCDNPWENVCSIKTEVSMNFWIQCPFRKPMSLPLWVSRSYTFEALLDGLTSKIFSSSPNWLDKLLCFSEICNRPSESDDMHCGRDRWYRKLSL